MISDVSKLISRHEAPQPGGAVDSFKTRALCVTVCHTHTMFASRLHAITVALVIVFASVSTVHGSSWDDQKNQDIYNVRGETNIGGGGFYGF